MLRGDGQDRFQPGTAVRSQIYADGGFLINVTTGLCFHLNPVGAVIWQSIVEASSVSEIGARLANLFPTTPNDVLDSDMNSFIEKLRQHELIVRTGVEPAPIGKEGSI